MQRRYAVVVTLLTPIALACTPSTPDSEPPCPAGFQLAEDGEACRPAAPSAPCVPGTMPLLGESECQPVGWHGCPAEFLFDPSGWGCTDLIAPNPCSGANKSSIGFPVCMSVGSCEQPFPPGDATLWVDQNFAAAQLDGSHFRTIAQALAAAGAGAVIAIEAGDYAETLAPLGTLTLAGRCPASVIIRGDGSNNPGLLLSSRSDVVLRGVTLRQHAAAIVVEGASHLTIEEVIIEENRDLGIFIGDAGSSVDANNIALRNQRPDGFGQYGWGAGVAGGTLTLRDSSVAGNSEFGVALFAGGQGVIERCVIRDTRSGGTGIGVGVLSQEGASVQILRSALVGNEGYGLLVNESQSARARATVDQTVIRGTQADASGGFGRAVQVENGAEALLTRTNLFDNQQVAIAVEGQGAIATLRDSVVRATRADASGAFGVGAGVQLGGSLTIENSALVNNRYYGLFVVDASDATLHHTLIADTQRDIDGNFGIGMDIRDGATVTAAQLSLMRNHEYGLVASGEGSALPTSVTLDRALIAYGQSLSPTWGGLGVAVESGAAVQLRNSMLAHNRGAGAIATDSLDLAGRQTELTIESSWIGPTWPTDDGSQGAGVVCAGLLTMRDVIVSQNTGLGVTINNPGSTATLEGVTISHTLRGPGQVEQGHGLVAGGSNHFALRGCHIRDNAGIGLAFAGATGLIDGGSVERNLVGIHAQGGSQLIEAAAAPELIADNQVVVTSDTSFIDNTAQIGQGTVPLPGSISGLP